MSINDSNSIKTAEKRKLLSNFSNHKQFYWKIALAFCLMLIFSAMLSFFLEGKSAYDLAFTLWDDRFAKFTFGNMGDVIMPQALFYSIFFVITVIIFVFLIKSVSIRRIFIGILIVTSILFLIFIAYYGIVLQTYLGARQGPAGWLILESPWLSLILLCFTLCLGLFALWILLYPDLKISNNPGKSKIEIRKAQS